LSGGPRATTRAHIARAALEAMALSVVEVQRAVEASLGRPFARLRVDGGAAANDLLLRMLATLGDVAVERPVQRETTALGAARIAMLGSGAARRPEDLPPVDIERVFEPGGGVTDAALLELRWREAVQRSRGFAAIGRRR
jgi:glycerol kinase